MRKPDAIIIRERTHMCRYLDATAKYARHGRRVDPRTGFEEVLLQMASSNASGKHFFPLFSFWELYLTYLNTYAVFTSPVFVAKETGTEHAKPNCDTMSLL